MGDLKAALTATTTAMEGLNPGVNQGYLVPFWHSRVLNAVGDTRAAFEALKQAHGDLMKTLRGFSPEEQRRSLENVPEHRAIAAAWEIVRPRGVLVRLPRKGVPIGRPLREDEWIEIEWTISTPEDEAIAGKVPRRRARLLRLVAEAEAQGAAPTVIALAEALDISPKTIKRDLAALRKEGYEILTRGSRR
jgi:DNA-binding transcriptional ArsR family regulator